MTVVLWTIIAILSALPHQEVDGSTCEVALSRIGEVRLGDTEDGAREVLQRRYSVAQRRVIGEAPVLLAFRGATGVGQPAFVVSFRENRAFIIDSYESCRTREGIGPGVTLQQAQKVYGTGRVNPTDDGYFVTFAPVGGPMFLLDDRDIPKSLRSVADDALSPAVERRILRLANARIVAVRVSGE